jgi:putative transposase
LAADGWRILSSVRVETDVFQMQSLRLLALRQAMVTIDRRDEASPARRPAGLAHHSHQGVQYASTDYTLLLRQHGAVISMSRRGVPYENAACESFMKTLNMRRSIDRAEF